MSPPEPLSHQMRDLRTHATRVIGPVGRQAASGLRPAPSRDHLWRQFPFRCSSRAGIPQSSSELKVLRDESKDVQVLSVVRTLGFAGTGRVLFLSGGL